MKKVKIIYLTLCLTLFLGSYAYPFPIATQEIATQDLFVIDALRFNTGGSEVNYAPTLISASLSSAGPKVDFPGGVTFTSTTAIPGRVINGSGSVLSNTIVTPGVLSFNNNQSFSLLTTSNLGVTGQTIGLTDSIGIDVSRFAPVKKGDVGTIDFSLYQFLPSLDRSKENGLSPLEIAALRAKDNRVQFPSLNGSLAVQAKNFPLLAEGGSVNWYFVGKSLVVGAAVAGAVVGGVVGVIGAVGAIGGVLIANAPEPSSLLMIFPGFVGLVWYMGRRLRLRHN